LKTFLTQIASTVPLTADPLVICFWEWIGWKDHEAPKNRNLRSVSAKIELFFSPTPCIPTHPYSPWIHPTPHSHPRPRRAYKKKKIRLFLSGSAAGRRDGALRTAGAPPSSELSGSHDDPCAGLPLSLSRRRRRGHLVPPPTHGSRKLSVRNVVRH
jgi:hypothetical protein